MAQMFWNLWEDREQKPLRNTGQSPKWVFCTVLLGIHGVQPSSPLMTALLSIFLPSQNQNEEDFSG